MPSYIAMLRGINVGGQKPVRMEQLRESCAGLGLRSVKTYVQSGNILFLDERRSPASLSKSISGAILRDFGFRVPILVIAAKEMQQAIERNPFLEGNGHRSDQVTCDFSSGGGIERRAEKSREISHETRSVLRWPSGNLSLLSRRLRQDEAFQYRL